MFPFYHLKGVKYFGEINIYIQGFRKNRLVNIVRMSVPGSAHFAPE